MENSQDERELWIDESDVMNALINYTEACFQFWGDTENKYLSEIRIFPENKKGAISLVDEAQ